MTHFDGIGVYNLWRTDDFLFVQNVYQGILGSIVAEIVADTV